MTSSASEPPPPSSITAIANMLDVGEASQSKSISNNGPADGSDRGRSPIMNPAAHLEQLGSSSRTPTSAEIDAVIAAAMANAPPPIPVQPEFPETSINRSVTPLMTNLLPSAVGVDGRVNLFVGNLPYRVRWQDLKDLFRKAGTVLRADVSLGPDNRSRGYGTVLMGSREDAARAIDRYNGYTWQTRTLEVRPDRLPPEYEPQTHAPHPHRPGVFPYHSSGHPPFPMSGHLTPQSNWISGQGRPPFPGHTGSHGLLVPGLGPSPVAPPMTLSGSSPIPSSQSPSSLYPSLSLPLSVQNTGGHSHGHGHHGGQPYPPLVASPLAGSLSAGTTPNTHTSPDPNPTIPLPRSTSPNPNPTSRPTSSQSKTTSPAKGDRAPPPGTLGPLPPLPFAAIKPVVSPTMSNPGLAPSASSVSAESLGPSPPVITRVPIAPIPQLEGLAHQGLGLGPPETLHDRVIFVSNLPLSIQWQDLKDLLRPAGTIIRADVATDANGRPRGFGTALFASEGDAARAVTMFNELEIQGQRIRAHLERDSMVEPSHPNGPSPGRDASALGFAQTQTPPQSHEPSSSAPPPVRSNDNSTEILAPIDTSAGSAATPPKSVENSPATKLPWSLNTSLQHQTPGRPGPGPGPNHQTPGIHQHTPNFRQLHHPGPISMPPFPPMQNDNPLSPLQTRGLPPMTPSMPGFVFNAPVYPETPPIHHGFGGMSNGNFGPFSPGIPVTSPNAFGYNPFSAPGAPIRFPQSPHPHQYQGSAVLGTPTTQSFPILNGNQPSQGSISQTLNQDYFPPIGMANNIPDTPTPKLSGRASVGTVSNSSNGNPLNAKERLASTASQDEALIEAANNLAIDGNRKESPDSPSAMRRTLSSNSNNSNNTHLQAGDKNDNGDMKGRISLDGKRPTSLMDPTTSLGKGDIRRASFDDSTR
ncbi:hypothetical protein V865_004039 [Kwoniella europaea PYCC6329]|uniref:RRM domain-containing protein n=1 Tax=Kwoniella europaea PYCC6329 TaxID=1423913 RepID=A0AAX4KIR9_9TREE